MRKLYYSLFLLLFLFSVSAYASVCGDGRMEAVPAVVDRTFTAGQEAAIDVGGTQIVVRVIGVNTQSATPTATVSLNGATESYQKGYEGDFGGIHWVLNDVQAYTQPVGGGGARLIFSATGAPEECDDGNVIGNDGCSSACVIEFCGDGKTNNGEQCDDKNIDNTDACLNNCKAARCGDLMVNNGEECDGKAVAGKLCTSSCTLADVRCGDGIVSPGESCDDGNSVNTDMCVSCKAARCGDGFVLPGKELCDDGNSIDTDACSNTCKIAVCGDNVKNNGEECDGSAGPHEICADCKIKKLSYCGDGAIQPTNDEGAAEQCDDGNADSGDGCDASCVSEARCGDGKVNQPSEQCDDGNDNNKDSCDSSCQKRSWFANFLSFLRFW